MRLSGKPGGRIFLTKRDEMGLRIRKNIVVRLIESAPGDEAGTHKFRVVLITEGKGNKRDRYYYSQKAIDDPASAAAFEGKPCYLNHQGAIDKTNRPEGDVERQCGYFSNVAPNGNALEADFTTKSNNAGQEASADCMDALKHSQEHPGMSLVGFSVNADGDIDGTIKDADGEWKNVIRIPSADSCDLVTKPARGGKVLKLLESEQEELAGILEQMRSGFENGADYETLRKMCESALTAAKMNQGEEDMFPPAAAGAVPTAPKPPVPGTPATPAANAEDEAKALRCAAYKKMAESHPDPSTAAKYKQMAEAEGDLTITHSGAPPVAQAEEESEAKTMAESEAKKKQDEAEAESKKKMTESVASLKTEVAKFKLRESGLPEVFHAGILREAAALDDKSLASRITEEVEKYKFTLRESFKSGVSPSFGGPAGSTGSDAVRSAFAARGL